MQLIIRCYARVRIFLRMIPMPSKAKCRLKAFDLLRVHTTGGIIGPMHPNGVVGPKPVRLGDATMSLVKMPKPRIGCGEAEVKCGAQRSVAVRISG